MDPYREKIERLGFQLTVDNVAAFARQAAEETERAKVEQIAGGFSAIRHAEGMAEAIRALPSVVPPREEP